MKSFTFIFLPDERKFLFEEQKKTPRHHVGTITLNVSAVLFYVVYLLKIV